MALTDAKVRNAKPRKTRYRIADQQGLNLEVMPSGTKYWRLRYRFKGRPNTLSLGSYPMVSLAEARERLMEAKRFLADGIDPKEVKDAAKSEELAKKETFEVIAREWHAKHAQVLTPTYARDIMRRLEHHVLPFIGSTPIRDIKIEDLMAVMKRMEDAGIVDTAYRQLQNISQTFRYAVRTGRADSDPTIMLRGTLPPRKKRHHASLTDPKDVAGLLRAIDDYEGTITVRCALKLAYLTFVRPGELRKAEWSEIDVDAKQWKILASKMTMRRPHIVPLSVQALEVLDEIGTVTGAGKYVFPAVTSRARPMSENAVTAALRRMGYTRDQMTGHGFRSMASTLLNELGFNRDWIERQLAHAERDEVRAAYNYAEHLPERTKMMQRWADYLDSLKEKGKVVPLRAVNGK